MVIGGLWHGASWNFVIWGAIHGAALALERYQGKTGLLRRLPHFLQVCFTFLVVVFAWVFFRANDLHSALTYCQSLIGCGGISPSSTVLGGIINQPYYIGSFLIAAWVVWRGPQTWDWTRSLTMGKAIVILILFWISILVMTTQAYNPFIYFIF
jgi:alginate O-acetyltransferase complex protein AlgI